MVDYNADPDLNRQNRVKKDKPNAVTVFCRLSALSVEEKIVNQKQLSRVMYRCLGASHPVDWLLLKLLHYIKLVVFFYRNLCSRVSTLSACKSGVVHV